MENNIRLNQEEVEIEFEKQTEEAIDQTMKQNEMNEKNFLASMKPISVLLNKS